MAEQQPLLTLLARKPADTAKDGGAYAPSSGTELLLGRLQAPLLARAQLLRERLLTRIESRRDARLVLIRAPAGFGKSTLMAQLFASRSDCAWLSLDASDNDPRQLAQVLSLSLRGLLGDSVPAVALETPSLLELGPLLARLAATGRAHTLFLDEFEALQSPDALELLRELWEAFPPGNQLVIASRSTPNLRLGNLRARGELLELNAEAMRFELDETRHYLHGRLGSSLSEHAVQTLQTRTEGWVTALHLAALSLQDRRDPGAFIATFSGSQHELAEYLTEDILSQLPPELGEFLLRTSLLERFCAPLCDALCGSQDSAGQLEMVQRQGLFLIALDGRGEWFRYHRLFAGFLRDVLSRRQPELLGTLHRAAAEWHLRYGSPLAAVEHLLQVDEASAAMDQLEAHLDTLLDSGRFRALLRCLDQLAPALIDQRPRLAMVHAWMLLLARRYQQALQVIERNPQTAESEIVRCLLLAFSDQFEAASQAAQPLFEGLPEVELQQRGVLGSCLAYSLVACGQVEAARAVLAQLTQTAGRMTLVVVQSVSDVIESVIDLMQGHLVAARARAEAAAQHHQQNGDEQWLAGRISVDTMRALTLYEAGELEQARHILIHTAPSATLSAGPDVLITSHITLARIAHAKGDRTAWVHHLAGLEQLGRQGGPSRLLYATWLERARVATLDGHLEQAAQALRSAEFNNGWERPGIMLYSCDTDTLFIARQRWRISRGDLSTAIAELREAIGEAQRQQRNRRVLKFRLLLAMALDGLGRQEEAFDALLPALQWASHEGFVQTFREEGERLAQLLQQWMVKLGPACSSLDISADYLHQLLQEAGNQGGGESSDTPPLSPRELDVLRLLAGGGRNQFIADHLCLSLHTVKTHLRNISGKLGAEGRTEVIAIARARRLID